MPCIYCMDLTCSNGSKCQQGLFPHGTSSPFVGEHRHTKKHSKRGAVESEHVVPKAALKSSGVQFSYEHEPTMSIPYEVHRGAQSGAGGGVSSTGSSSTAEGWSAHLGQLIRQGDPYEAIRLAVIDELNAAAVQPARQDGTHVLNEGFVSGLFQIVNMHAQMGRLSATQSASIQTELYNAYLSAKTRGWAD